MLLKKALEIATQAHKGQFDKGSQPYISHPIRVALRCNTEKEKIVALLHDVLEDTDTSLLFLKAEFDEEITIALQCLTKVEGEDYNDFINRIKQNPLATQVKIQDIIDNLDESRLNGETHWKKDIYLEALSTLKD